MTMLQFLGFVYNLTTFCMLLTNLLFWNDGNIVGQNTGLNPFLKIFGYILCTNFNIMNEYNTSYHSFFAAI
jgi:hypothetical protein